jgi:hypothetical protein
MVESCQLSFLLKPLVVPVGDRYLSWEFMVGGGGGGGPMVLKAKGGESGGNVREFTLGTIIVLVKTFYSIFG